MKCFKEHMKLCMLTLMCILFLGVGIRAEAAPEKVTGFRQEDGNDTIAVVQWDYISEEYGLSFPGRNMMNSSITSKMPRPMKIAVYMISFIRRTTIFVLEHTVGPGIWREN